MKLERILIFLLIVVFLGAIFIINRFTTIKERKTNVFVQGTFYIDKKDMYKIVDDEMIEKMLKKVDPDILGGMIVILHNEIIDGSVRRGLDLLEEQLVKVKVV